MFRRADRGPGRGVAAVLDAVLPADSRRIAVLAVPGEQLTAELASRARPAARVETFDATAHVLDRHAPLTAGAPWDALVDAGPPQQRLRRVLATYYHLRPGGVLVLRGPLHRSSAVRHLLDGRHAGTFARSPDTSADVERLAASLAGKGRLGSHGYLVRDDAPVFAKLDEPSGNRVLELRPELGRVLEVVPGETYERRGRLRQNDPHPSRDGNSQIVAPQVALREYREVLVAPRQLVIRDNMLLPDTFRHNDRRRTKHKRLDDVAWLFARPRIKPVRSERLAGVYYHLDNEARGHFGHLLTEQLSRLWAWEQVKSAHPDLKAVVAMRGHREMRPWEYELFEAAGIARDDVVFLRRPAYVEHLVSPAPLFCNPNYVHPKVLQTWDAVGDRLQARSSLADAPRRIFVGRATDKRRCLNGNELEARFVAHGFTVVYPEQYSIADQVALFRGAEAIAGYAGSGLFTMCFVKEPTPVTLVGSSRYSPRNESLIAAARGLPLTMITSRPLDDTHLHSDYRFDFARDGALLEQTLGELA